MTQPVEYGNGDATYQAAGQQIGIRKLVDCFFDFMGGDPKYATIYEWHPEDKEIARDKLALFLCGWMGGPKPFIEKYGPIRIPEVHRHLDITALERDLWLDCMSRALAEQDYSPVLVEYLLQQLYIPAERVRQACMGQ
jgi:hemoglobin